MSKYEPQAELHRFYCTQCGNEGIPIMRKKGKKRGLKHLKKLHCLTCEKETNHCEISPMGIYQYADFKKDFDEGKFQP